MSLCACAKNVQNTQYTTRLYVFLKIVYVRNSKYIWSSLKIFREELFRIHALIHICFKPNSAHHHRIRIYPDYIKFFFYPQINLITSHITKKNHWKILQNILKIKTHQEITTCIFYIIEQQIISKLYWMLRDNWMTMWKKMYKNYNKRYSVF